MKEIFEAFDKDNSQQLDFDEFLIALRVSQICFSKPYFPVLINWGVSDQNKQGIPKNMKSFKKLGLDKQGFGQNFHSACSCNIYLIKNQRECTILQLQFTTVLYMVWSKEYEKEVLKKSGLKEVYICSKITKWGLENKSLGLEKNQIDNKCTSQGLK